MNALFQPARFGELALGRILCRLVFVFLFLFIFFLFLFLRLFTRFFFI